MLHNFKSSSFGINPYWIEFNSQVSKVICSFLYYKNLSDSLTNTKSNKHIYQNCPNPINPSSTIAYATSELSLMVLIVYNLLGEEIKTLVDEVKEKGYYKINCDRNDLATGI